MNNGPVSCKRSGNRNRGYYTWDTGVTHTNVVKVTPPVVNIAPVDRNTGVESLYNTYNGPTVSS